MSVEYQGKYNSDFSYYVNLPESDNKERFRMLGWLFDLLYRNGYGLSAMVTYLAIVIGIIVIMNYFYLQFFTKDVCVRRFALQMASFFGIFMGPMYIPVIHEYFYSKSFQTFAWHSPTEQSMIMLSIPTMICFIKMYEDSEDKLSPAWWSLTMITALISAFAKPAFVIDLIAAMIVVFLIDLFASRKERMLQRFRKLVIMGCSLIPAGIYILIVIRYDFEGDSDVNSGAVKISIEHLLNYDHLLAAIICGLAFPILVFAANPDLLKKKRYSIVFMTFLMGVIQWALFVEDGTRASHGNFSWGRQVGCYFFFITSVAIALSNWGNEDFMKGHAMLKKMYFTILAVLLLLHVGSQLRYFYLICRGYSYFC